MSHYDKTLKYEKEECLRTLGLFGLRPAVAGQTHPGRWGAVLQDAGAKRLFDSLSREPLSQRMYADNDAKWQNCTWFDQF